MASTKVPIELSSTPGIVDNSNATAITIDSSENVGIGTSNPNSRLYVVHPVSEFTTSLSETTTKSTLQLKTHAEDSTITTFGGVSGGHAYIQRSNGSGTTAYSLLLNPYGGNVGIGTSSPSEALHVSDTGECWIKADSSTATDGSGLRFAHAGTNHGVLYHDGSTDSLNYFDNIAGSTRFSITGAGVVTIGTTTTYGVANGGCTILGNSMNNSNVGILHVRSNDSGETADECIASFVSYRNDTSTSNVFIKFAVDQYNSGCGQINANGPTQAAFGSFSDSRLKENIVELPSQLDNIKSLRPVEFDYIESEGGGHQIGFIAQEVEEIYPDLVGERADGMKTLTGLGKFEARLIKAIQELSNTVDNQQTIIEDLKARIETLENA